MDFKEGTPTQVISILENARLLRKRIRVFYGDPETGENWNEENDVVGHIGSSMGPARKIPILLPLSTSIGGSAILCDRILAVKDKGRWLYRHPKFVTPKMRVVSDHLPEGYSVGVDLFKGGKWTRWANFKHLRQANRYIAFMTGKRFTK